MVNVECSLKVVHTSCIANVICAASSNDKQQRQLIKCQFIETMHFGSGWWCSLTHFVSMFAK